MLSNKVKTPNNTSQVNENASEGFRIKPMRTAIILVLSGIITTGAFLAGKASSDSAEDLVTNPSDAGEGEGGDGDGAKNKPKGKKINNSAGINSSIVPECTLEGFYPDEVLDQAQKILQERYKKAALAFINRVGIKNPKDIEKIMKIFSEGCTKYAGFDEEDGGHYFESPDGSLQSCWEWEKFKDELKVPDDLQPEEDDEDKYDYLLTDEEKKWKDEVENGEYKKILDEFDFDEIDLSEYLNGNEDAADAIRKNLDEVVRRIKNTKDQEKKGEIVCRFMESLFEYMSSFDDPDDGEDENDTEEYVPTRNDLLFGMFLDALGKAGGVDDFDDCQELYSDLLLDNSGEEVGFF